VPLSSPWKDFDKQIHLLFETHCGRDKILIFSFTHAEEQRQLFRKPLFDLLEPNYGMTDCSEECFSLLSEIHNGHEG